MRFALVGTPVYGFLIVVSFIYINFPKNKYTFLTVYGPVPITNYYCENLFYGAFETTPVKMTNYVSNRRKPLHFIVVIILEDLKIVIGLLVQ